MCGIITITDKILLGYNDDVEENVTIALSKLGTEWFSNLCSIVKLKNKHG